MKLINYEKLDELVRKYELLFITEEELDIDEQKLLLQILLDRRDKKYQDLRMKDSVNNMPLGSLMKKILKKKGDDEE